MILDLGIVDGNVRTDIDGIIYPGDDFVKFQNQAVSSGQISPSQMHKIMHNAYDFVIATGQAIESRFPEMSFVL